MNTNNQKTDSVEVLPESQKSEVALREETILAFWEEHQIFNKSIEKDAPNGDFVFYDGPPFATGLPHYGHILAGTIKDAIPRFWTMNGYRVRRKWGWDCHGLPLENLIEKKLGLATKRDIEDYGVKNFNEAAREAVLEYADDWKKIIPRMGRWADMDDDYKTMDSTYTESVWWVFSELNRKGLVYEGFKSMHLCPRCGTTLSNFEVNQGYKDIKDIAVTVKLPLIDEPDTSLLVWTTTPWTLPGNMAAAVHNEIDYVKVKVNLAGKDEFVILAKARLTQLGEVAYEVAEEFKGSTLVAKSYIPPFTTWTKQEFEGKENAWKIYHADYVELGEEGTGAVHLAPAYGEEDMNLAKEHNIPILHHVDESGHFFKFVEDFECRLVKPKDDDEAGITHLDADIEIVRALNASGRLFKKENITHSYPHCWRCDTPLLNYATTSWFVRVTDLKDKLVEENNKVHWVPEHVGTARFGNWLEGARDWAISRQRYWGAPLPIWRNPVTKEYKVFGSLAELQEHIPKKNNRYFVMRHAEAESNISGTINALLNETNPLTEKGREQCHEIANQLKNEGITKIVHSGLQRGRETAMAIAQELGLDVSNVIEEARIIEIQVGADWEGKTWDEFNANFSSEEEKFTKNMPGVEKRLDLIKRVGEFLYEYNATNQNETTLIVGHGSSIFGLHTVAEGADTKRTIELKKQGYLKNAEIKELAFVPMPHNDLYQLDYHRPYIDDFEVFAEDGTKLERVLDVFDCWFESGSMPYGQLHYPFTCTEEEFQPKYFPAQFIAEGLDQTRGWFYSLIVLGTALFGKSPYQNVIVNGLVLAEDGKKMSKKLQNYPDPMELADRVGVDAIRYYLLSAPIMRGEDLNFSEKEVLELQRKNIGRLHNILAMYEQYQDGTEAKGDSGNVLDRWIIARLNQLINESTVGYKNYELDKATRPIADFVDDLSVWYLRRSRDRLKQNSTADSATALQDPTASVAVSENTSSSSVSPRLVSEDHQTNSGSEVIDDKTAALGTLRYVLRHLSLVMAPSMPFYAEYLWSKIKEEGDVESVHLTDWPESKEVDSVVIADMSVVREVVNKALEARTKANIKVRQPIAELKISNFLEEEFANIVKDEVNVKKVSTDKDLTNVWIDEIITPELKAEGNVREFMRGVQEGRKVAGLEPQDRVVIMIETDDIAKILLENYKEQIMKTVGATELNFTQNDGVEITAGEHKFKITITKN